MKLRFPRDSWVCERMTLLFPGLVCLGFWNCKPGHSHAVAGLSVEGSRGGSGEVLRRQRQDAKKHLPLFNRGFLVPHPFHDALLGHPHNRGLTGGQRKGKKMVPLDSVPRDRVGSQEK